MKRLDAFRTIVAPSNCPADLSPVDGLFFLGSCFADNVGQRVRDGLLDCCVNPFGTVYNPSSMAMQMRRILYCDAFEREEMVAHGGMYHSWRAHSCMSAPDEVGLIMQIEEATKAAHEALMRAKMVCLTLGTAWVYELKDGGGTVANCHKMPAQMFNRRLMSVDEVAEKLAGVISELHEMNAGARVVLTVSPIRHLRDGAHENQISKATLLMGIDAVQRQHPEWTVDYFASYEMMMDDLRDYRFYADDMAHPSPLAVDYIYQAFAEAYFAPQTLSYTDEASAIRRALDHRPFAPQGSEYQRFVARTLAKAEELKKKYKLGNDNRALCEAIELLRAKIEG